MEQLSRQDSLLDDHVMREVGQRSNQRGQAGFFASEAAEDGGFADNALFFAATNGDEEEGTGDVTPILSDVESFWGTSAAPEVVVAAIEEFMADFVEGLLGGELAEIELNMPLMSWTRNRSNNNNVNARNNQEITPSSTPSSSSSVVLSLSSLADARSSVRSFHRAMRVCRLMSVLDIAHEALSGGRTVTIRDVYYRWRGGNASAQARSPADVSSAVTDAQTLLALPREALGLRAAPRGSVAGCIWVASAQEEEEEGRGARGRKVVISIDGSKTSTAATTTTWTDLRRTGPAGFALPGCPAAARSIRVATDASYLVVVEKDAVFERLVEDKAWERVSGGAVFVTAKGMPDVSTRAFCSHLLNSSSSSSSSSRRAVKMEVLGLCDYNPSGVAILTVYKNGSLSSAPSLFHSSSSPAPSSSSSLSARAALEGAAYALNDLRWLGARSSWFLSAAAGEGDNGGGGVDDALQPLTDRDLSTARSLASAAGPLAVDRPQWIRELETMAAAGVKAELEAVEAGWDGRLGSLSDVVARAINAGDWV